MLTIDQIREPGYYLFMNSVRDRAESIRVFGPFPDVECARKAHEDAKATDSYTCLEGYRRAFREDTRFFWFNPLTPSELEGEIGPFGHGIVIARKNPE